MRPALRTFLVVPLLAVLLGPAGAPRAEARGLIRDAGIEHALAQLAYPLMSVAGLPGGRTPVLIVNDMRLNAFVIDGRAVFLHAGLFLRLDSAEEVQAVIAHELAHITNGHFTRRGLNAQNARLASILGLAAGVAAGLATGNAEAGAGIAMGTAGSARNRFFAHTRAEETAADRTGMRYLARAGIDPGALARALSLFAGQEDDTPSQRDLYARSHPLSRDRIRAIHAYAEILGPRTADSAVADYWFARAQAKLSAYLRDPDYTFQRYPAHDTSDAGHIARALAHYKLGKADAAMAELDTLIDRHPQDAYIRELKGWIALESNRLPDALVAYADAAALAPREAQILAGYGRALLAQDSDASDIRAIDVLRQARLRDRYDVRVLRDLGMAYARTGDHGMAALSSAERYALIGDHDSATIQARRAEGLLPTGSPGWSRAQDIIAAAKVAKGR